MKLIGRRSTGDQKGLKSIVLIERDVNRERLRGVVLTCEPSVTHHVRLSASPRPDKSFEAGAQECFADAFEERAICRSLLNKFVRWYVVSSLLKRRVKIVIVFNLLLRQFHSLSFSAG